MEEHDPAPSSAADDTAQQHSQLGNESSDSTKGCRHITAAVNIPILRKRLKQGGLHHCEVCGEQSGGKKKSKQKQAVKHATDLEKVSLNGICIACGFVGCLKQSHCTAHLQHMAKHYCMLNMATKEIWCAKCDGVVESRSDRIARAILDVHQAFDDIVVGKSGRMLHAKALDEDAKDTPTERPTSKKSHKVKAAKNSVLVEQSDGDSFADANGPSVIPGLANLGNTCYFNSTIQALKGVFLAQLVNQPAKDDLPGPITQALIDFILDGSTTAPTKVKGKRVYNPSTLLTAVREKCRQFRNRAQQDAFEMLLALVWAIDDEFSAAGRKASSPSPPNEAPPTPSMEQIFVKADGDTHSFMVPQGSSVEEIQKLVAKKLRLDVDDLFVAGPAQPSTTSAGDSTDNFVRRAMMGCLVNTVVCATCGTTSKSYDSCISVTVSIPKDVDGCTIQDCLAAFTAPGVLSEAQGSGYNCDHCNATAGTSPVLHTAAIRMQLHTPSPVLVVHLKRLTRLKKINRHVAFSMTLDVAPYHAQPLYGPHLPTTYALKAVVVHSGNRFGGHYVAYVKHGDQWLFTSDTSVKVVSEDAVLGAEAYMLLYAWSC